MSLEHLLVLPGLAGASPPFIEPVITYILKLVSVLRTMNSLSPSAELQSSASSPGRRNVVSVIDVHRYAVIFIDPAKQCIELWVVAL